MNCIILGARSDIARMLWPRFTDDGWDVFGWHRQSHWGEVNSMPWDLILCAIGRVAPVGLWHDQQADSWELAIESNLLRPVRQLRTFWDKRLPNASVCFMAGSNPQKIM